MTRLSLQCFALALLLFLVSLGCAGWAITGALLALGLGVVLAVLDLIGQAMS
ncbi:hypothetical protein [Thauera phenylacetica]|uniref:hypothetical protein n=1 Tax=Thauera phenylacetica TaxID=164400 RepID=UPI0003148D83|nr:hypothetical protein [Thauera phenylacetica]